MLLQRRRSVRRRTRGPRARLMQCCAGKVQSNSRNGPGRRPRRTGLARQGKSTRGDLMVAVVRSMPRTLASAVALAAVCALAFATSASAAPGDAEGGLLQLPGANGCVSDLANTCTLAAGGLGAAHDVAISPDGKN